MGSINNDGQVSNMASHASSSGKLLHHDTETEPQQELFGNEGNGLAGKAVNVLKESNCRKKS